MYKFVAATVFSVAGLFITPTAASAADTGRCVFYTEPEFRGKSLVVASIDSQRKEMKSIGAFDNKIASFHCDPGCSATLHRDVDFKGHLRISAKFQRGYGNIIFGLFEAKFVKTRELRIDDLRPTGPISQVSSLAVWCVRK